MMEGVGSEAASLAGHLRLGNLCWIYDSNHITIEGHTALAFSEDVAARFLGYGWQVLRVSDANDRERIADMIADATAHRRPADPDHRRKPYRLRRAAQAGYLGSARRALGRGRSARDQAPLRLARGREIPGARRRARAFRRQFRRPRQKAARRVAGACSSATAPNIPNSPMRASACSAAICPRAGTSDIPVFPADPKGIASRDSSAQVLNAIAPRLPWLIGGAADLAPFDQDPADLCRRRRFRGRPIRRPQLPFRHPRARDGLDLQRHVGVEIAALRLGLSDLFRLHEGADPTERADGIAGRLHLHP